MRGKFHINGKLATIPFITRCADTITILAGASIFTFYGTGLTSIGLAGAHPHTASENA